MKNKIKLLISTIVVIQIFFSMQCFATETNEFVNYEDALKAVQRVAYSFYMRGPKIQYNSNKGNPSWFAPEEATSQNIKYMVCATFTKNVYYDLLGIKIPSYPSSLITYAKDNVGNSEVIAYGYRREDNDYVLKLYDETSANNYKEITNPTLNDIIPYLQVGDVLTYTGHVLMVYKIEKDENNETKVFLIQSGHGAGKTYIKTKIAPSKVSIGSNIEFGNGNHRLYYNSKLRENLDEGRIEGSLSIIKITDEAYWKEIGNNNKEYSILRFIQKDNNGNAILKYNGTKYEDKEYDNEIINLSDKTKDRLKYNKLYIEKTVDVHADNIVVANDKLTYSILIKNDSEENYTEDIHVTEKLSKYVTYGNGEYEVLKKGKEQENYTKQNIECNVNEENKEIEWNIGKLNAGEETVIKYTVKVKEGNIWKTIESTGMVEHIPSSVIKNKIGNNLTESQAQLIEEKFDELKGELNGKELINETYKQALGVDLKLTEFEIKDVKDENDILVKEGLIKNNLVKNKQGEYIPSTSSNTVFLNTKNKFYNMVLNKYWSTIYQKSYDYKGEGDVIGYDLKLWRGLDNEERRSDTIYGKTFKTGDILIYQNSNDVIYSYSKNKLTKTPVTYENGEYIYIYIEGRGFVGVNYGADGIAEPEGKTSDDRNEFNPEYYTELKKASKINENGEMEMLQNENEEEKPLQLYLKTYDENNVEIPWKLYSDSVEDTLEFANYQTLLGKDYYVILRPSLSVDIVPMKLNVEYSTTEQTNQDVTVTITSNEAMWKPEGWEISENRLTLTKIYNKNTKESLIVYDNGGKDQVVEINIENIDKDAPVITGIEEGQAYEEAVVPKIKEENLKEIKLYKDGQEEEYKIGDTIKKVGKYRIVVTDKAGNAAEMQFSIYVKGDITGEGELTTTDLLKMKRYIVILEELTAEQIKHGDMNGDGEITTTDIIKAKRILVEIE